MWGVRLAAVDRTLVKVDTYTTKSIGIGGANRSDSKGAAATAIRPHPRTADATLPDNEKHYPEPQPVPRAEPPLTECDVCGSTALDEIRCKVICRNCRTILRTCSDL